MTRKNWVWLVKLVSLVESLNCLFKKGLNKEVKTCKQARACVKRKEKSEKLHFLVQVFFLSSGCYDAGQTTGDFSFFSLPQILSTNEGRIVKVDIPNHLGWTGSVREARRFSDVFSVWFDLSQISPMVGSPKLFSSLNSTFYCSLSWQ